jgi:hypothetical protein
MFNSNQGVYYRGVQTVSPAGSGNATNGLSVDPVSGDYVLGNNTSQAGAPAQLLSDREIITNNNRLTLKDTTGVTCRMLIGNTAAFNISLTSSVAQINYGLNQGILPLIFLRQSDGAINIGQDGAAFNNAQLQISGTMTSRLLIRSQSSGSMNLDRTVDSGKVLTNSNATGQLTINLPSIVASNYAGFHCYIVVDKNNGIRVTSPDATINVSGQIAAAGAFVTSALVGSVLHLVCIAGGTHWHAMSVTGSWII